MKNNKNKSNQQESPTVQDSCKTAKPQEVIETLTEVMRNEDSTTARLKAAELLGKKYGIFSDKNNSADIIPVYIYGENDLED